jgi:hypothetical protein
LPLQQTTKLPALNPTPSLRTTNLVSFSILKSFFLFLFNTTIVSIGFYQATCKTSKLAAMDDAKLREIHDSLIQIAFESGEKILAATPTTEHAGSKKNCEIISLPSIILAIS